MKILKLKTLLAMAENSLKGGDNYFFRNIFAINDNGQEVDILQDGNLSCAVFVSSILLNLELIKHPHATVNGTEKDMLESGWIEVTELKPGAVLVWEKITFDDNQQHRHIGFCINNQEAISNSTGDKFPRRHPITYGTNPDGSPVRKIEKILWHPDLDQG